MPPRHTQPCWVRPRWAPPLTARQREAAARLPQTRRLAPPCRSCTRTRAQCSRFHTQAPPPPPTHTHTPHTHSPHTPPHPTHPSTQVCDAHVRRRGPAGLPAQQVTVDWWGCHMWLAGRAGLRQGGSSAEGYMRRMQRQGLARVRGAPAPAPAPPPPPPSPPCAGCRASQPVQFLCPACNSCPLPYPIARLPSLPPSPPGSSASMPSRRCWQGSPWGSPACAWHGTIPLTWSSLLPSHSPRLECQRAFEALLAGEPRLRVAPGTAPAFGLVCFQLSRPDEAASEALLEAVNATGGCWGVLGRVGRRALSCRSRAACYPPAARAPHSQARLLPGARHKLRPGWLLSVHPPPSPVQARCSWCTQSWTACTPGAWRLAPPTRSAATWRPPGRSSSRLWTTGSRSSSNSSCDGAGSKPRATVMPLHCIFLRNQLESYCIHRGSLEWKHGWESRAGTGVNAAATRHYAAIAGTPATTLSSLYVPPFRVFFTHERRSQRPGAPCTEAAAPPPLRQRRLSTTPGRAQPKRPCRRSAALFEPPWACNGAIRAPGGGAGAARAGGKHGAETNASAGVQSRARCRSLHSFRLNSSPLPTSFLSHAHQHDPVMPALRLTWAAAAAALLLAMLAGCAAAARPLSPAAEQPLASGAEVRQGRPGQRRERLPPAAVATRATRRGLLARAPPLLLTAGPPSPRLPLPPTTAAAQRDRPVRPHAPLWWGRALAAGGHL